MNGRIYDPVLARFLNADPLLQDNTDGQNYNRYSYVLNNPTKYTDPSGYAYNGFTASNNDIGASSTSYISDATKKIEDDYSDFKSGIARDASDDYSDPRGGTELIENDDGRKLTEAEKAAHLEKYGKPVPNSEFIITSKSGVSFANLQASFGDYSPYYQNQAKYTGGSSKDISLGVLGFVVGGMEVGYLNDAKQVFKYGQQIGGQLRSAAVLTRANSIGSSATAKYFGYAGKALGVYSAFQHSDAAITAFQKGEYADMLLNIGKTGFDAFFILNKSVNPIWFGVSVGYTVIDIYTSKP